MAETVRVTADVTSTPNADARGSAVTTLRPVPTGPALRERWQRRYALALATLDACLLFSGITAAALLRWGAPAGRVGFYGVDYYGIAAIFAALWLIVLAFSHAYDARRLGLGSEEFRRVADAAIRVTALVAFVTFVGKLPLSRGFVAMALPIGLVLTVAGRYAARRVLHRLRRRELCVHRVLVVGTPGASGSLAKGLSRSAFTGYQVVGTWAPSARDVLRGDPESRLREVLARTQADTVAVASTGFSAAALRDLAWQLEGTGIDLLVSPALTDVAGPRVLIRPVDGLPLLHVEEPALDGPKRWLKSALDRTVAATLLVLGAPLFVAVALAIRVSSPGPAFFRQRRSGKNGKPFSILKFRTMCDGADAHFASLVASDVDRAGGMFVKDPSDGRVTRLGRWLRRYSIDELPQLFNVLRGDMSLVGPRPLPESVEQAGSEVRRRLLVLPGMTGLWQVSGRSELPLDESVRLDLYYVENWSPAFDLMILWKTLRAVLRGSGAY